MPHLLIRQFVHEVMAEASLNRLDATWRRKFTDELSHEVARKIGIAAVQMLDEKGRDEYKVFIKQFHRRHPTSEEVDVFFRKHVSDYNVRVRNILHEFAQDFLVSMKMKG